MSVKYRLALVGARVLRGVIGLAGGRFLRLFVQGLEERIVETAETGRSKIHFFAPNPISVWRAQTMMSKEPETIGWIDSFTPESVLWDVGANIGVYSLYCAVEKKCQVVSFEPSASNFYALCRNVEINGQEDRIMPFCIALNDESKVGTLDMSSSEIGTALSTFASASRGGFRQASLGFSIDDLCEMVMMPFPNYIKIDVDGLEHLVIQGAERVLEDERVKEILIELDEADPNQRDFVVGRLREFGFEQKWKKHAEMFDVGEYRTLYNYLFTK